LFGDAESGEEESVSPGLFWEHPRNATTLRAGFLCA